MYVEEMTSNVNASSRFYFQAAIGAQALDYAKKTNAGPEAEKLGQQVSSIFVHLYDILYIISHSPYSLHSCVALFIMVLYSNRVTVVP